MVTQPIRLLRVAVCLMASWLINQPVHASPAEFQNNYAIVIGIDHYPSLAWPSLDYAKKDARAFADFLKSQGYKVRTLLDSRATRAEIMKQLSDVLAPQLGQDDRVVIFFSGHGETKEIAGRDRGYIIPYDGKNNVTSWISMAEMRDISDQMSNARHQLLIFDSCYGGQIAVKGILSSIAADHPRYIEKISENKARQFITAGGKGERVLAGGPDGYSYFTGYLLQALSGKADLDGDSYVTSSELEVFLRRAASNWDHTPIAGVLRGHEQGDFWFRHTDEEMVEDILPGSDILARLSNLVTKGNEGAAREPKQDWSEAFDEPIKPKTPAYLDSVIKTSRCARKENLTEINGIGVKTQNILYKMGICLFEDIENMTLQDEENIKKKMPWTVGSIDGSEKGYIPWRVQAAQVRSGKSLLVN